VSQQQKQRVSKEEADEIAAKAAARQQDTEHGRRAAKQKERQDKLEGIDDLLDEIDGLLEEQEVLANFRQRGGE
jgi:hypothetical protein